jgi:hypothetical protein
MTDDEIRELLIEYVAWYLGQEPTAFDCEEIERFLEERYDG